MEFEAERLRTVLTFWQASLLRLHLRSREYHKLRQKAKISFRRFHNLNTDALATRRHSTFNRKRNHFDFGANPLVLLECWHCDLRLLCISPVNCLAVVP